MTAPATEQMVLSFTREQICENYKTCQSEITEFIRSRPDFHFTIDKIEDDEDDEGGLRITANRVRSSDGIEHGASTSGVGGSSPSEPTIHNNGEIHD